MHGTLNHLLVAEHRVWFPRFADGTSNRVALDAELETDRAALREQPARRGGRWPPLIAGWPAARFDGRLDYTTTRGVDQSLPFALTLSTSSTTPPTIGRRSPRRSPRWATTCPELDLVWMLQAESAQP